MDNYLHIYENTGSSPLNISSLCTFNFNRQEQKAHSHIHTFWEIGYVLVGKGKYHMEGQCYNLSQGDLVLVLPGTVHLEVCDGDDQFEMVFLLFRPEFSPARSYNLNFDCSMVLKTQENPEMETILRNILAETMDRTHGYELLIEAELTRLFIRLNRLANHSGSCHEQRKTLSELINVRKLRMVDDIKKFMEENVRTTITMSDITAKFFISPQHLVRLFRELGNCTPKEYLTRLKMKKAMELLSDPTLEVNAIAEILGYTDIHHFYRVFRKEVAKTPLQYRMEVSSTYIRQ